MDTFQESARRKTEPANSRRLSRPPQPASRVGALVAGFLIAVGLLGFTATTASAAGRAAAQTCVGASSFASAVAAGLSGRISPGQGPVPRLSQPMIVVATGVGAEAGARMPGVIRAGELKLPGVPEGAIGTPVRTGKGLEYQIPRGTPELAPRVTSIRVMDPVTTGKYQYPNGYVSYMNKGGQAVNPLTGGTLQPSDPLWHIELP